MRVSTYLIQLLFPARCLCCDEIIPMGETLCTSCAQTHSFQIDSCCIRCGKPLDSCICKTADFAFSRCISALTYGPELVPCVNMLKHQRGSPVAGQLAHMMVEVLCQQLPKTSFDGVTEVPMQLSQRLLRKHNQAETLARLVAQELGISHQHTPLVRREESVPQHTLSVVARRQNALQSYEIDAARPTLMGRLLLVDDIMTTGATLNVCARLLLSLGAHEVVCLTACTTPRRFHENPATYHCSSGYIVPDDEA